LLFVVVIIIGVTNLNDISPHRYYRPIFDRLKIGRYTNWNFTMIRDARYLTSNIGIGFKKNILVSLYYKYYYWLKLP